MDLLTQDSANEIYTCLSAEWDYLIESNNIRHAGMIPFSNTAMEFLYHFTRARDVLVREGFIIPELVEGFKITQH